MEQPAYFWSPSVAVAGSAFYQGKSRAWKDSVFIGSAQWARISRLKLAGNKVVEEEVPLNDRKAHASAMCAWDRMVVALTPSPIAAAPP